MHIKKVCFSIKKNQFKSDLFVVLHSVGMFMLNCVIYIYIYIFLYIYNLSQPLFGQKKSLAEARYIFIAGT